MLVLISALLLFQLHKQRITLRRQQDKLQELLRTLKRLKLPPPPAAPGTSYRTYLQAQQTTTIKRLQGSYPNFRLDEPNATTDSPEARALALRLRILQIEESAIEKGDGPLRINWQQLESQLTELLGRVPEAPQEPSDTDEIATYKKRIENLEKFKTLFFDMEGQWQRAQSQAEDYYTQLSAMASDLEDPESFTKLLGRYQTVYQDINQSFVDGVNSLTPQAESEIKTLTINRIDPRAGEEIVKLRNVAADQHRIINQLQRKLEQATTAEAKEEVVNELQQQLQRQTRFVQESETCIKLLEDELAAASEKISQQQQRLESLSAERDEGAKVKSALEKFTLESKDLMKTMLDLESENAELKRGLKQSIAEQPKTALNPNSKQGPTPGEDDKDMRKSLEAKYSALEREYALLEEKYLELKMK